MTINYYNVAWTEYSDPEKSNGWVNKLCHTRRVLAPDEDTAIDYVIRLLIRDNNDRDTVRDYDNNCVAIIGNNEIAINCKFNVTIEKENV